MPDKLTPSELEVPNAATAAAMEEARDGRLPSFGSVSDLIADLNSKEKPPKPPVTPARS